jgi:uncharacterized Zn-finger protein
MCHVCGLRFKKPETVLKHINEVDNNIRRFECDECDKRFKKKTHLDYHKKTHANPNGRKRGLNKPREVPIDRTGASVNKKIPN